MTWCGLQFCTKFCCSRNVVGFQTGSWIGYKYNWGLLPSFPSGGWREPAVVRLRIVLPVAFVIAFVVTWLIGWFVIFLFAFSLHYVLKILKFFSLALVFFLSYLILPEILAALLTSRWSANFVLDQFLKCLIDDMIGGLKYRLRDCAK